MMSGMVELLSPLSKAECLARLRAVAKTDSWFNVVWPSPDDPMLVRVRDNQFRLMKAAGGPPRNAFRRMLNGEVLDHPQGALIRARFCLLPLVRLFLLVWFGGVGAFGVLLLVNNLSHAIGVPFGEKAPGWSWVFPGLMGALGIVLVRLGISLSRAGEEQCIQYLGELLGAAFLPAHAEERRPTSGWS